MDGDHKTQWLDWELNPGSSVYETDALPLGHRASCYSDSSNVDLSEVFDLLIRVVANHMFSSRIYVFIDYVDLLACSLHKMSRDQCVRRRSLDNNYSYNSLSMEPMTLGALFFAIDLYKRL